MRLAVIGSRTFTDYSLLQREIITRYGLAVTIVSGEAPGADSLGKLFSEYWLVPLTESHVLNLFPKAPSMYIL